MDCMMTDHARQRSVQRNISEGMIELILQYGDERPAPGGARRVELGKLAKARLKKSFGPKLASDILLQARKCYVILSNGRIITVAPDKRNATR
jgi:hypothetical protein